MLAVSCIIHGPNSVYTQGRLVEIIFVVVLVIALALFFDFTNGFHDTANAMATPIATGAIKPKTAVTPVSYTHLTLPTILRV